LHTISTTGSIGKFQFVQRDFDRVVVRIVTNQENETIKSEIRRRLQLVMGKSCEVDFEVVDDIPPLASGKYLYTFSQVSDHSHHSGLR
jgi:phenylacetate-CoA ligase